MKKILVILALIFGHSTVSFAQQCNYPEIEGTEYRVPSKFAKYVKNDFLAYPDRFLLDQGTLEDYTSLISNPFKVTKTNSVTHSSADYKGYLSKHRFKDVVLDGKAYHTDSYYNIEVTTSDCQKFYFDPSYKDLEKLQYDFVRTDGQPITIKNYFDFLGNSVAKLDIKTTSEYDRFEKKSLVETEYFKQYLIRGYFDKSNNKINPIQIYLDTVAFSKLEGSDKTRSWNNIRLAKDTDANSHEVTQISYNSDCKPERISTYGCVLDETIGINVSEQFLRKHKDGFELKLIGDHSFEKEISGDVVRSFLKEVDKLKKSKK